MAFITINPRKVDLNNKNIRVSFRKYRNTFNLFIYIPTHICSKLNLNNKDYIKIFYDNENNRNILIKKTENDLNYKIRQVSKKTFMTQLSWNLFIPNEIDGVIHNVPHDFFEDGIKIFL